MTTYNWFEAERMGREGYEMVDVTEVGDASPKFIVAMAPGRKAFQPVSFSEFEMMSAHEQRRYIENYKVWAEGSL